MLFYGKTDVGQQRSENQDNFIIKRYASDVLFAVVCDGMGGANGGSTASSVAINAFADCLDEAEHEHPAFYGMTEEDLLDLLSAAATEANRSVYRLAQSNSSLTGMGTTLVGCLVAGEHAYIVNVGDSRLYAVSDGFIEQVTHDHSWVQYMIDNGAMTPEAAKRSSRKNQITRCIGIGKTVDPDLFTYNVMPGSYAVLCSDGLTNHVEPAEIRDIVDNISVSGDIQNACESLINCANGRGGSDNITAVVLSM